MASSTSSFDEGGIWRVYDNFFLGDTHGAKREVPTGRFQVVINCAPAEVKYAVPSGILFISLPSIDISTAELTSIASKISQ